MFCATQAHTSARPAAPSRGTRHKQTTNTHAARRQLFSQIAGASCARSRERASSAGSEGAARRAVRSEKQRTRANREPRQRKADFPWRPRTPRAPHLAPRASRARSWCARPARRRSRGAERTEQERARSRGKPQGSPGRPFPPTRTANSKGARRSDSHAPRASRRASHAPRARS